MLLLLSLISATELFMSTVTKRLPVLANHRLMLAPAARPLTFCCVPLTSTTNGSAAVVNPPELRTVTRMPMLRLLAQPPVQPLGDVTTELIFRSGPLRGVGSNTGVLVRVGVRVGGMGV